MQKRIRAALLAVFVVFAAGEIVAVLTIRRASNAVVHSIGMHRMLPGQEEAVASMEAAVRDMHRAQAILTGTPAGAAILMLGVVWWLSVGFAVPVRQLVRATRAVGAGDLDHLVKVQGAEEFVELGRTFNEMTARLGDARERLRQSARLAALGEVAAGVAHNFGNLLVAIQGFADVLLMEREVATLPPAAVERITIIQEGAERGTAIVRRLSRFARGGTGEVGPVSLADVVESSLVVARGHPLAIRARLTEAVPDGLPQASGNAEELGEVLVNLLINAYQAMPQGGAITISAGVRATEDGPPGTGAMVWLSVADTGSGIAPENLRRVFEPFYTQRLPGQEPGTGLGLSSSLGMVQRMGGDIHVESSLGVGTTFTLILPQWREDGDSAVPGTPAAPTSGP